MGQLWAQQETPALQKKNEATFVYHQPRTLALPQAGEWYHRVYRAEVLVSRQINRQLFDWYLLPQAIRAFGAPCRKPTHYVPLN